MNWSADLLERAVHGHQRQHRGVLHGRRPGSTSTSATPACSTSARPGSPPSAPTPSPFRSSATTGRGTGRCSWCSSRRSSSPCCSASRRCVCAPTTWRSSRSPPPRSSATSSPARGSPGSPAAPTAARAGPSLFQDLNPWPNDARYELGAQVLSGYQAVHDDRRLVAGAAPRARRVAADAQPVGSRAQEHPRGRGRRPGTRQERRRLQDAEPHARRPDRLDRRPVARRPDAVGQPRPVRHQPDVLRLHDHHPRRPRPGERSDHRHDHLLLRHPVRRQRAQPGHAERRAPRLAGRPDELRPGQVHRRRADPRRSSSCSARRASSATAASRCSMSADGAEPVSVLEPQPGVAKSDPILVADSVRRAFGGLVAVDVDHVEVQRNEITALIGPNGAGKTTFFNLLTGFDEPDTGRWLFDGHDVAGASPHKLARLGMVRTFQLTKSLARMTRHREHAPRRQGAARRALLEGRPCNRSGERRSARSRTRADELLAAVPSRPHARRVRRQPVRRAAQAARDGEGADGRPDADHARRADGRREPGAEAEPAPAHPAAQGRGPDGAVRRARHGHGPRDQRLGAGDGRGSVDRRGDGDADLRQPGRDRRLPRRPPRGRPRGDGRGRRRSRSSVSTPRSSASRRSTRSPRRTTANAPEPDASR